jgi:hypothetical protein
MTTMPSRTERAKSLFILLGASNAARSLPRLVATIEAFAPAPPEIYAAIGHGRSYGLRSRVLVRTLPSIIGSELWSAVPGDDRPCHALVTDIGNDVIYGVSPEQTARWVDRCLERLRDMRAITTVTQLPMASIRAMGERRYRIVRALLFPDLRLSLRDVAERAEELNERIVQVSAAHGIDAIEQPASWFGFDGIHIRYRTMADAWARILGPWSAGDPIRIVKPRLPRAVSIKTARPSDVTWLGRDLGRTQPARRLHDGGGLHLH